MTISPKRFYRGSDVDTLLAHTHTADVVIVGAGQAGPSIAWSLEQADPTLSILVTEANSQLAAGASPGSLEAFRTAWVPQAIAEQMRWSARLFLDADTYLGEGAGEGLSIRQNGYLWLAMDETEAVALKASVDLLHLWGITHAQYLTADDVRHAYPWLPPHITGAKFDPVAGWLNSDFLANRFAARTQKTRFLMDTQAQAILIEGGRVTGVRTDRGVVSAGVVVLAAGPGVRALGRTADIEIPVICIPRQSFMTPYRQPDIPDHAPLVISRPPYAHFRPEGQGLLFAWSYHRTRGEIDPYEAGYITPVWPVERLKDARYPELTLYLLGKQFRQAEGQGFRDPRYLSRRIGHQIGYYVYREPVVDDGGTLIHSERAIIDRWPDIDGLILATAHVGHGIMTAPATGEIAASLALGREPRIPLWQHFGLGVKSVPYEVGGGL